MRHGNVVLAFLATTILGIVGCDKIPTWGELTGEQKPPPAVAAPAKVEAPAIIQPPAKPAEPASTEIIAKFKAVRPADMSDNMITQLTSMTEGLDQVTEINADGSRLTSNAFGSIEKLTNLRQLRLIGTLVDNEACNKIALVPSLEVLALTDTAVSDVGVAAISSLPNLKQLELTRCRLGKNAFVAIGHLPALEVLLCEATDMSNDEFNDVCNAKTLKSFRVISNPIDDAALGALKKLPALEQLELGRTRVTGEGLLIAAKGGNLKTVTVLGMYGCPMTAAGAKAVSQLKSVEQLSLGEIALTDEALYTIISGMKKLKFLNLNRCASLTGEGLAGLKGAKEFEVLFITQCPNIGDPVVPFLKTIKSLKELYCGGSAISPTGISVLKSANPDLKVQ